MAKKTLDFEKSLQKLEDLVEKLEDGDLSLEDSLAAFEQGVKLTQQCQTALANAEQKVQLLMEKNGDIAATALPIDDENEDDQQ